MSAADAAAAAASTVASSAASADADAAAVAATTAAAAAAASTDVPQTQYWLVQLPPWVLEDWGRSRPPGSQIAELVTSEERDPKTQLPLMKIRLHTDADIPVELDLQKRDGLKPMLVFDNASGGDAGTPTAPLRAVDSLTLTCNALPTRNERYERFVEERKRKFDERVNAPTTKKLLGRPAGTMFTPRAVGSFAAGGGASAKRARLSSPGSSASVASSTSASAAASARRNSGRVDRRVKNENVGAVVKQLLELFQVKTYYSLSELGAATQQPADWLKSILADVCVQSKQGPHRNQYSLNEKYSTGVALPEPV